MHYHHLMTIWRDIYRNARCRVWARIDGPAVEMVCVGRLNEAAARAMTPVHDEAIDAAGHTVAFHDWWDSDGYETPHRVWWEKWLAAKKPGAIQGVYFITRSVIIRMGLSVANIKYPHLQFRAFGERGEYDRLRLQHMSPRTSDPRRE
jgi:hypothetical protein